MSTAIETIFTPDDLLRLPDSVNYELVDGKLVERHMGAESSEVAMRIGAALLWYVEQHKSGHVLGSDTGYQCFADAPQKLRKPDVSFVRAGRFPGERTPKGHVSISPDLVVEVLSPGDLAYEVDEKLNEYLSAGVPLIWIVNPKSRTVRIHRPRSSPSGPVAVLEETDTITGEDVLPDFSRPVSKFFGSET
jgi:Uma2 family endonuclease